MISHVNALLSAHDGVKIVRASLSISNARFDDALDENKHIFINISVSTIGSAAQNNKITADACKKGRQNLRVQV